MPEAAGTKMIHSRPYHASLLMMSVEPDYLLSEGDME